MKMNPVSNKEHLMSHPRRALRRTTLAVGAALTSLALVGCGQAATPAAEKAGSTPTPSRTEVGGTRLGVSYAGGVMVLDAGTLELVGDLPREGFLRLNPAGDQRHLLVSAGEAFEVLDTGVEVRAHGDHVHYYGGPPALTGVAYPAPEPGHAVVHAGTTALFSDGSGTVQLVDADAVASGQPERTWTAPTPHHGVAVPLADGSMLVSVGTAEGRTGAQIVDAAGTVTDSNAACPGVHGEATTADATLVGCTDGVLVHDEDGFTKIDSPDDYGRIGNQAGSPESPVVLGDYKVDEDAELERPERISLVDTERKKLRLVDLGTSYSFRSLGRGPDGEALVLGTDGALHVVDPDSGKVTRRTRVVRAWSEPLDWQQPRPTLHVDGILAYVTEPATSELHVVDLTSGKTVDSVTLPHVPNELSGV
jgi:hypothetical protein